MRPNAKLGRDDLGLDNNGVAPNGGTGLCFWTIGNLCQRSNISYPLAFQVQNPNYQTILI